MQTTELITRFELEKLERKFCHYLKRWRRDPIAYAIEACHIEPSDKQSEILYNLAVHKFVAIRSGRGIGKTRTLGIAVNWFLDTMWEPGTAVKVPCTGPSGGSLQDILWSEVAIVYNEKNEWLRNRFELLTTDLHCREGPDLIFATLRTARKENPESLQGFHGKVLNIIDEGEGVPDEVFDVLLGSTDEHVYAIVAGNPTRLTGYFHRIFKAKKEGTWKRMHVSCYDTLSHKTYEYLSVLPTGKAQLHQIKGRVAQRFIDDKVKEYGAKSNYHKTQIEGEFGTAEGDPAIPYNLIETAFNNAAFDQGRRKRLMGIDPGWKGEDNTGLAVRHGLRPEYLEEWHGNDTVETTERAERVFKDFKARKTPIDEICVDVIGVGAGVYDNLSHHGYPVRAVIASESAPEAGPQETKCHRMRDWLWWQARRFFQDPQSHIVESQNSEIWAKFRDELSTPLFEISNGEVKVQSKDDLPKSPNLADAFNLTLIVDWTEQSRETKKTKSAKQKARDAARRNWKTV